jgi:signal transduction histidine kinase/putative methionine-R-sulfoxide reductase with GAF domain
MVMRRIKVTPGRIEGLLLWLFIAAVLFVVFRALFITLPNPDPFFAAVLVVVALAEPALSFFVPRRYRDEHKAVLTLADTVIVGVLYLLTGGMGGTAPMLLYILIALAAVRLRLEYALAIATLGGLILSTRLFLPLSSSVVERNLAILVTDLLSYYAVAFIFHFFAPGQREAGLRRDREFDIAENRRLLDQQQVLVRVSREISNSSSLSGGLEILLQAIRAFIPCKAASIILLDNRQKLFVAASEPDGEVTLREMRLPPGEGISGWIEQHQQPFFSPDLDQESRLPTSTRHIGTRAWAKSVLGVPLLSQGNFTGILQAESDEPYAFGDEHRGMMETIAAQVAGAIEYARLFEERREFSRRLQEAYETANELTSQFDLDFILQRFAARAAEMLKARYAAAATLDANGHIANFVTTGLSEAESKLLNSPPQGRGLLAHVFHGQTPMRIDDCSKHPDSFGFPPHHPVMHTLLAAPLIARGETHGAIYVSEKFDGEPFTAEDQELLIMLTAGASAAVSNALLYNQLRRNIEQLYALHQIGQAIGSSLSSADVFRVFTRDVKRLCGAEAVVISQWNTPANRMVSLSCEGQEDLLAARERPYLRAQLNEIASIGQTASLSLHHLNGSPTRCYGLVVPLSMRAHVLGLVEVYSHSPSLLGPESSSLFQTLASQLAVGMENSRLYGELQLREEQLRHFVVRLFQAQDEERRRMAYDIHDGLAQLIVSADMHLSNFASLRRQDPALDDPDLAKGLMRLKSALNEVRRVVSELRPSTLDDFGLVNTIRRHLEELSAQEGWEFSFQEDLGEMRLDPTIETGAFRIIQESLNNARKHSGTSRVEVELRHDGDHLQIHVQDWGTGFDIAQARQLDGHFGLSGMEERARLLGGSLAVESVPGEGTQIHVDLPCYLAFPTPGE